MPNKPDGHDRKIEMLMHLIEMFHAASKATSDGSEDLVTPTQATRYGAGPPGMMENRDRDRLIPEAGLGSMGQLGGGYMQDPRGNAISATMSHPEWLMGNEDLQQQTRNRDRMLMEFILRSQGGR
jgi:hypothetical protein